MTLTIERVRELLAYEAETGALFWISGPRCGCRAGCARPDGRRVVGIDGTQYLAYRVVWLIQFGRWPTDEIDHINGDSADDRLANLQEATRSENMQNVRRANSNSGLVGVSWCKREQVWRAYIKVGQRMKSLGYHPTPEAAQRARADAKVHFHPYGAAAQGLLS